MIEREELLKTIAKRFAEAQLAVVEADEQFSTANAKRESARELRDRVEKELHGFVGRNQPRRIIFVREHNRAVLVQMDGDAVYVSLEDAL